MKRGSWSVESTIGLVFTIALAVIVAMVLAVIGLTAYAVTNVAPEQTIVQKVETTGDVRRLCIEAKTGARHRIRHRPGRVRRDGHRAQPA